MFNYNIAMILVSAKKQGKWAPVKYLVKYGLNTSNVTYLEDKGYVVRKQDPIHGTMIRLTLEGYYAARTITETTYTKEAN